MYSSLIRLLGFLDIYRPFLSTVDNHFYLFVLNRYLYFKELTMKNTSDKIKTLSAQTQILRLLYNLKMRFWKTFSNFKKGRKNTSGLAMNYQHPLIDCADILCNAADELIKSVNKMARFTTMVVRVVQSVICRLMKMETSLYT